GNSPRRLAGRAWSGRRSSVAVARSLPEEDAPAAAGAEVLRPARRAVGAGPGQQRPEGECAKDGGELRVDHAVEAKPFGVESASCSASDWWEPATGPTSRTRPGSRRTRRRSSSAAGVAIRLRR